MLQSTPKDTSNAARTIVLKHPNSIDCAVYRKRESSQSPLGAGDAPLDDADAQWDDLGYGMALLTDPVHPSSVIAPGDAAAHVYPQFYALIEATADPSEPAHYVPERHDIVLLLIHEKVKIAYEIVSVESSVAISAHTRKYMLSMRPDLSVIDGIS